MQRFKKPFHIRQGFFLNYPVFNKAFRNVIHAKWQIAYAWENIIIIDKNSVFNIIKKHIVQSILKYYFHTASRIFKFFLDIDLARNICNNTRAISVGDLITIYLDKSPYFRTVILERLCHAIACCIPIREQPFFLSLREKVPVKSRPNQLIALYIFQFCQRFIGIDKGKVNRIVCFVNFHMNNGNSSGHLVQTGRQEPGIFGASITICHRVFMKTARHGNSCSGLAVPIYSVYQRWVMAFVGLRG